MGNGGSKYTISGRVSSGGIGLPGVLLTANGLNPTTTDSDGYYTIATFSANTYSVTPAFFGYSFSEVVQQQHHGSGLISTEPTTRPSHCHQSQSLLSMLVRPKLGAPRHLPVDMGILGDTASSLVVNVNPAIGTASTGDYTLNPALTAGSNGFAALSPFQETPARSMSCLPV